MKGEEMDQESIIRKYKLNELSDILDAIEDDIAQAIIEKRLWNREIIVIFF